jgi:hypothetical protein
MCVHIIIYIYTYKKNINVYVYGTFWAALWDTCRCELRNEFRTRDYTYMYMHTYIFNM